MAHLVRDGVVWFVCFRKKYHGYHPMNLQTWYRLAKVDLVLPTAQDIRDLAALSTRNLTLWYLENGI